MTWTTVVSFGHLHNVTAYKDKEWLMIHKNELVTPHSAGLGRLFPCPYTLHILYKWSTWPALRLVTVLRSCLVCAGLDSVLVGKLSELSHLSSWANRVSEAPLSHLNDTNPLRAVATALVQGLTCISQQTLKGTEVCSVLPEPWCDWQPRLIGILNTFTFRIASEG